MPAGPRIRSNNVYGITVDNPLTSVATTMNSTGLSVLPTVSSAHSIIVLDPKRVFGDPEIVVVTSHVGLTTSAVITRAQYGTTARSHPMNTAWAHVAITGDYTEICTSITQPSNPYIGELIFETDTVSYKFWNGSAWVAIGAGGGGAATLGYAQSILNQNTITTEVDLDGLSVTVTVPAGRRIRISTTSLWSTTVNENTVGVEIYEGATRLQALREDVQSTANFATITGAAILTPSAGSHTYKLRGALASGTGSVSRIAAADFPSFILVEDITDSQTPFANPNVPVGQLAYAQAVANQGSITTETDLTGLFVNISVPAGRVIRISSEVFPSSTVANDEMRLLIKEGATTLQIATLAENGANQATTIVGEVILSPSAGAHTYKLALVRQSGTGTITNNAGATFPSFINVEDITPTPAAGTGAPSSTLGYAEKTVDQTGITAITPITGLSVNVTVPAGRRLRITSKAELLSTVSADKGSIFIRQDGAIIQGAATGLDVTPRNYTAFASVIVTPTAGAHTYTVDAERTNGTGSMTVSASSTLPAFLLVEDVTGAMWPAGGQVTSGLIASEPWTAYTPTFTNLTVGSGTLEAAYYRIGRTIHYRIKWVFGVGSAVGTSPAYTLPVTPHATYTATYPMHNNFHMLDSGTTVFSGTTEFGSGVIVNMLASGAGAAVVDRTPITATVPMTWATGDTIFITGTYEAAS